MKKKTRPECERERERGEGEVVKRRKEKKQPLWDVIAPIRIDKLVYGATNQKNNGKRRSQRTW